MKILYTLLTIALIACLILCPQSANAIDDIGFGGGTMFMMRSGQSSNFGYYTKIRLPIGVEKLSITESIHQAGDQIVITADTVETFEVIIEPMIVRNEFEFRGSTQTEVLAIIMKMRKTIGFRSAYVEGGLGVWDNINNSPVALKAASNDNKTLQTYYLGGGFKPFDWLFIELQGHILPQQDGVDTYAIGIGFNVLP